MENHIILSVQDLDVKFTLRGQTLHAIRGVSLDVYEGESLAIVGESGSGKSVFVKTFMGLLDGNGSIHGGSILYHGQDLTQCRTDKDWLKIRGREIAMVLQDPMTSLNPVYTVGNQIMEMLQEHEDIGKGEAKRRAIEMLRMVGIPSPEKRIHNYPHEFSGGMRQRAMIAIALACSPKLLIADEPTTALDVTIQAQILNLIKRLNRELDMTTILITHDLGVVATLCDKVVVMYGGLIMEDGTVEEIFYHPKHPYTMGLIDSIPRVTGGEKQRLKPIPGTPPNLIHPPKGCPFSTRCPYCMNVCMEEMPPYFQEDGHRTMCWLLHEEAPVNPEYVQRKEAMRRADG